MARTTPFDLARSRLQAYLGERTARLPRKWEKLGDVLVVRFQDGVFTAAEKEPIAAEYAEVLGARVVLEDRGGIRGPLREPQMVRLFGEGSAETTVVQDGILYRLDAERVMFASGNIDERVRMGRIDARTETVVDLFAGIGYFTLPLLVKGRAAHAIACELNPVSARYLSENAERNGVGDRIDVREGDCRAVAPRGVADRVLLGWFPGGFTYLDVAIAALRPTGGVVHYHDTANADRPASELRAHLDQALVGTAFHVVEAPCRVVKSYAPGVVHAVVDARLTP